MVKSKNIAYPETSIQDHQALASVFVAKHCLGYRILCSNRINPEVMLGVSPLVQQMEGSEVGRQFKVAKYHVHIVQSSKTTTAGSE